LAKVFPILARSYQGYAKVFPILARSYQGYAIVFPIQARSYQSYAKVFPILARPYQGYAKDFPILARSYQSYEIFFLGLNQSIIIITPIIKSEDEIFETLIFLLKLLFIFHNPIVNPNLTTFIFLKIF